MKGKNHVVQERQEVEKKKSSGMINAIQTLGVNDEVSKLIVDWLAKIPDSLKMGAFVAASVKMMNRSVIDSLCIINASAYAYDRWAKGHK